MLCCSFSSWGGIITLLSRRRVILVVVIVVAVIISGRIWLGIGGSCRGGGNDARMISDFRLHGCSDAIDGTSIADAAEDQGYKRGKESERRG